MKRRSRRPASGVPGYSRLISAAALAAAAARQSRQQPTSWHQAPVPAVQLAAAQPVGERREDRIFRRPVLARLVVTQPVLMQTGKAGDLPLRNTILIKHRDDEPKITPRACVENVLPCADPLDDPAHLRESQNHGALPVPMVDRSR